MGPLHERTSRRSKLPRNVVALGLVSLLTDVGTEIVYPFLPLFLTSLGASLVFIGLVEGSADAVASLLRLVAGWLSDRLGKRKAVALVGYGLSSATRPALALAFLPWHVLGARFIDRIGKGLRGAPRDALIADSIDASQRGRAFGFHRAMDHAGAVIGPLIAFAFLLTFFEPDERSSASTLRSLFWVAVLPAALAVITLFVYVREVPPRASTGPLRLSLGSFDGRFKGYLGAFALFGLGNSSDAFLLLRANELGVPTPWIPILWVALHVSKSAASIPGGAWSDRVGRRRAIGLGWAWYALVYLGFAFASQSWHAWFLFAAYGIHFGLCEGAEKALIADLSRADLRSTAFGLYGFAIGAVALPASLLMGWLWEVFSAREAFLCGALLALAALALLALLPAAPRPEPEQPESC